MILWAHFSTPLPARLMKYNHLPLSPATLTQNKPFLSETTLNCVREADGNRLIMGWSMENKKEKPFFEADADLPRLRL